MIKYVYRNGFHFVGKFNELIEHLDTIENKNITLREYILSYKQRLN
jgi:cell shape-determining protein MreC